MLLLFEQPAIAMAVAAKIARLRISIDLPENQTLDTANIAQQGSLCFAIFLRNPKTLPPASWRTGSRPICGMSERVRGKKRPDARRFPDDPRRARPNRLDPNQRQGRIQREDDSWQK